MMRKGIVATTLACISILALCSYAPLSANADRYCIPIFQDKNNSPTAFLAPSVDPSYLIITTATPGNPYYPAAQALQTHRGGEILHFNADDLDALLPELKSRNPRYIAIVLAPWELHINFTRQFLIMATQLDSDPFTDFSYGFITGATSTDALGFVNNIIRADKAGIKDFPLNMSGYSASSINFVYTVPGGYEAKIAPDKYSHIYMEENDTGAGRDFFLANANYMHNSKVLDIGDNGDPHMLWLFNGGNLNPNPPVWDFDPAKIENPAYERMGLSSRNISKYNFYPAVAFNGACHSGETKHVMIESDIMATFGDTKGLVKFHNMSDGFSFALQMLKTNITGYFAPCGANNANDKGDEFYDAFRYGEPLGDVAKRTSDGVVMGFCGNAPALRIYGQDESIYLPEVLPSGTFDPADWSWGAMAMLGGKANRIYFGDPFYNPLQKDKATSLNLTSVKKLTVDSSTIEINMSFSKPDYYVPNCWDKFHYGDIRIYDRIEVPSQFFAIENFSVTYAQRSYNASFWATEDFDNKTYLHVEFDITGDMYSPISYNITFRIKAAGGGPTPEPVFVIFILTGIIVAAVWMSYQRRSYNEGRGGMI